MATAKAAFASRLASTRSQKNLQSMWKKEDITQKSLFEPHTLGSMTLSNRIILAPLTRNRAGAGLVPSEFAVTYYGQRASAGLIIAEATQISPQAQGYQDTPRLHPGADRWLAAGHRCRPCQGRANLPTTVARRACIAR